MSVDRNDGTEIEFPIFLRDSAMALQSTRLLQLAEEVKQSKGPLTPKSGTMLHKRPSQARDFLLLKHGRD